MKKYCYRLSLSLLFSCILVATEQCTNGTCSNGGTCINLLKGGFVCVCPAGYSGILCQNSKATHSY